MLPGVYLSTRQDGGCYYRASITNRGKHISLGSYPTEEEASLAYQLAGDLLTGSSTQLIEEYPSSCILSFHKWVVLINFRDNQIYFKNPIYLRKRYFLYYMNEDTCFRFDVDDLFYYANHKIMQRGGHLFVSDYGMQVTILSRYGIKNYAIPGKDYIFSNGDNSDFRYHNIEIINRFHGVTKIPRRGQPLYLAKIHINGDYLVGRYLSEIEAAIAYNKASDLLKEKGFIKNFPHNFIDGINEAAYASIYQKLRISKRLLTFAETITGEI